MRPISGRATWIAGLTTALICAAGWLAYREMRSPEPLQGSDRELASPDQAVLVRALARISQKGPETPAAVPVLARLASDPSQRWRAEALYALSRANPSPEVAVEVYSAALAAGEPRLQRAALEGLAEIGPPARDAGPAVLALFRTGDADDFQILKTLERLGIGDADVVGALVAVLTSGESRPTRVALQAIARLGPRARASLPAVVAIAARPGQQRWAAIGTLDSLQVLDEDVARALESAASDPDEQVRVAANRALAHLAPYDSRREAVDRLARQLRDPEPSKRQSAAERLAYLGPAAAHTAPALLEALRDPEPLVGRDAYEALVALGAGPIAELRRGGCLGPCPVYSVGVFENGTVVYTGRGGVKTVGVRVTQLSPPEVAALQEAFEEARFDRLQPKYLSLATDLPGVMLRHRRGPLTHQVEYEGGPPDFRTYGVEGQRAHRALLQLTSRFEEILHIEELIGTDAEREALAREARERAY